MRQFACDKWIESADHPQFFFLTGDLGFMSLEGLQETMKERFINVGVAEQNMISVAAGLALEGMNVWAYSIAPFCYARPFEQIRNDICHHDLPVKIVGNGGGYGYGAMGKSHHAIEDYGALLTLPNMRAYIPAFGMDLKTVIPMLNEIEHPAYLRLGRCEAPREANFGPYSVWRKILEGGGLPIVIVGPLAGAYWSFFQELDEKLRPELWVLSELLDPGLDQIPNELIAHVEERGLCIVEEHTSQGSAAHHLCSILRSENIYPRQYFQCSAKGYPSGLYGSQSFHRRESGLEPDQILKQLNILP